MKIKKTILKNGLRIITAPMIDNPTITVMVLVEAGSKYENKKVNGISHFLEHMCFKGTEKRPKPSDISRELDSIGASYNAFTSQEFTGYYAKADKKHSDLVLDVVSDLYLNPTFDANELEKEKGVIVQEIAMYEDIPQRNVHDYFMQILYGDTPAGRNIAGTKESVKAISREDMVFYRKNHYKAGSTTVVVAGNFNEKEIIKEIKNKFSKMDDGRGIDKDKVKEIQKNKNLFIKDKKTDQAHLVLGFRAYNLFDKKLPILGVMSTILGGGMSSRLFSKLRDEMGVAYYVKADTDIYTDHGVFLIMAGVDIKRIEESITAIINEVKKFLTEAVDEKELRKAKDYIAGRMLLGLESSDDIADFYGFQELLKKEYKSPQEKIKEIEKVTSKDIMNIAKEIIKEENMNMAIITSCDKKREESIKKVFKL